jgi:hypothetical protein
MTLATASPTRSFDRSWGADDWLIDGWDPGGGGGPEPGSVPFPPPSRRLGLADIAETLAVGEETAVVAETGPMTAGDATSEAVTGT